MTTTRPNPAVPSAPPVMPRGTFWALLGVLAVVLVLVFTRDPIDPAAAPRIDAAVSIELRAVDQPDGAVLITDAATNGTIHTIHPGEDSFIRSTLRSLARERRIRGVVADAPFTLSQQADGAVWLEDRATGTRLALAAYGWTQQEAFARLFGERRVPRAALVTADDSTRSPR